MKPTDADSFEKRVAMELCYYLMTTWHAVQDLPFRERTHSTTSVPGLAFESVRLEGRQPDTLLSIYFRDVTRCQFLFGWRIRLWSHLDESRGDEPEVFAYDIWDDFFEGLDILEPELPPTAECNPHGVTWLRTRVRSNEGNQTPWLGLDSEVRHAHDPAGKDAQP